MAELSEANVQRRARELFDKGLSAMEHANLPYAMDMFAVALQIEPRFLRARKFLQAAALKHFKAVGRDTPLAHGLAVAGALPQLVRATLALRNGKPGDAVQTATELLRKDPLNRLFIRLQCRAAKAADMPEIAALTLSMVRDHLGQNPELLFELGTLYMSMDQPADAKECFEAAAALKPNDGRLMQALKNAMARETMAKGGWDEAARGGGYRSVIKDLKEASVLEKQAMAVKDQKSAELLMRDLEQRVKQEPENVNYRRALANLYLQTDRFDDARRTIEEVRRLSGAADPQLDQLLATVELKRFDTEIAQCRENGDQAGIQAKDAEKAAFLFKNTQSRVERYPNDLTLRFDFGVLLYEHGQWNEAIQQFQLAQRNPRHRVRALYYMALCFQQKQQLDMAREQLEKAAAELTVMDDLKKDIYYHLGGILEQTGDLETAINKYFKEIYQVDIGYKDVAAKIEQAYARAAKPSDAS